MYRRQTRTKNLEKLERIQERALGVVFKRTAETYYWDLLE